ncbi:TetR/AcrR family transcriptional regulator [Gammaproteobacteria bacterium]|jgi:AcrR family transcriptional regulator|nr:TetR/AcrR family transcriptional regulator [Gammaproteobacteria bacterium]MDB4848342.1 TetR/AcrR family transcriptional regulator [Gammaproteobacteria bacterium]MDC0402084.1 TetR/AcrR family transcriptional regulator [Gammaproteobacteria bacterium]MDC0402345.1 TetR/AcrR family transcriptional regulator [Gammaproteobacteria bacterium]MDC1074409.1 TetR/AcrR family transcriptional regulator [Gammaproteobacteria bacterium]
MNKVSKLKTIKSNKTKGRQNVEKKLIESAAVLVGSIGPNQLTIRDIADHAGVNHAQIHHYFGGKDGLLTATYKLLAFEHIEQLQRRNVSVDNLISEPLGDITNNYFKAIIRAVLDNRMDLVRVQVDSNLSMSKKTLDQLVKLKNEKKPTAEMKAAIAIVMVVEFGLASMKPYIMEVLDINEKEMKKFMDFFFKARQSGLNEVL